MTNEIKITREQQKLVSSAIRIQILHALANQPMTSKQVAKKLGKTPGSIHYHVQLLHEGGLLELVDTKNVRGATEKYFISIGTNFTTETVEESDRINIGTNLQLTIEERKEFLEDIKELYLRWERRTPKKSEPESKSFVIRTNIEEEYD